ncbi:MAG: Ig-like domain-containing protein [Burkholderiaceae bacterium]|nr:Ig-like domain-containing protein [Burkholderiaceae bacterium]
MALILEITQHNGLVVRQPIDPNSAKIAAQPGDKLRVLDAASGQPAGDLVARRVGDSLVVEQAGGATVELTEFFAQCAPGEGCELVLEDGEKTTTISQATEPMSVAADGSQVMYDGSMAAQAGAAPAKEGAAAAADSAAPAAGDGAAAATPNTGAIIAGVGAIGLAAAAGGGGGGGGGTPEEPDETPPDAPMINAVAGDDIVNQGEETNGVEVSGTAEAGSTVSVTWGGVTKTATAGEDGSWSVTFAAAELPADGATTISATAADAAGNVSEAGTRAVTVATDTVDSTPPDAPTVDAVGTVNAAAVAAGVSVSGTAEPGSTVDVTWGALTAQAVAAGDGSWTANFDPGASDPAAEITATATDASGNTSTAASVPVVLDATAPAAATIDDVAGDNVVSAAEAGAGVDVTGTAEEGSTVEVTWGGIVKTAVAGAGGAWSVNYTAGEIPADGAGDVSVMVTDAAGNPQTDPAATLSVDVQAVADSGATAGDDVLVGGTGDSVLFGGDGNDILVGDSAGSVRNYQFDYWTNNAGAFDPLNAGNLGAGEVENSYVGYDVGATFGGWTVGASADPGTGGLAEMRGTGGGYDDSGTGGTHLWETVFTNTTGGAILTQPVDTVAGETYTLSITFGTAPEGTSFQVWWNGAVIASYDGSASAPLNEPGNWTGTAPTVVDHAGGMQATLSFSVPGVGPGTALELRAIDAAGGDGEGVLVHRVTLEADAAAGNDVLVGGAGNDLIFGQGGNDTLTGGEGADTFVFSMFADNGNDVITDFEVGTDRIMLVDALDANTTGSTGPEANPDSDTNLTFADFMAAGTQEITLGDDGSGNLMLTFSGEGGNALGSVTLQGVDAAAYTTVESLVTGGIIGFTGDGFHADLMTPVI